MNIIRTQQKKIFTRIALGIVAFLFVFISLFAPMQTVRAQGTEPSVPPQGTVQETQRAVDAANAAAKKTAKGDNANPAPKGDMDWKTRVGQFLGNIILNLASIVTWFGGKMLEESMDFLIFGMGDLVNSDKPLGVAINSLWITVRNICNLAFIFGFIYIGFRTIFDNDSSGAKRTLAQIIIAALLINFSLFFTKFIIDFSNILAIEIKNAMTSGTGTISEHIANLLGISGMFNVPSTDQFPTLTAGGNLWFYFMGAIFLITAGLVLAAGGILIIIRFAMLVFIMICSPVLFGATIFPKTAHYATELWSKLLSYSFFAPAYLLVLLFSMKIVEALTTPLNPTGKTISEGLSKSAGEGGVGLDTFAVLLLFTVAIVFLVASLKIGQAMSIAGANKAMGAMDSVRKGAQGMLGGATFGAAGAISRRYIGGKASEWADNKELKDKAATSFIAKQKLKLFRKAADSSFDVRSTDLGKKMQLGEGRKGGYETVKKEVAEKEKKFGESLGEVGDDDVRVAARKNEIGGAKKSHEAQKEELNKLSVRRNEAVKDQKNAEKAKIEAERVRTKAQGDVESARRAYQEALRNGDVGAAKLASEMQQQADAAMKAAEEKMATADADLGAANTAVEKFNSDIGEQKGKVTGAEEEVKKKENQYEREKLRRQIGTTFIPPETKVKIDASEKAVEDQKTAIKAAWKDYAKLEDEEEKQKSRDDITKMMKDLKDKEDADKNLKKELPDRGYAGTRERSKWWNTWIKGDMVHYERKAGEEMRKSAEKGLPKKKED